MKHLLLPLLPCLLLFACAFTGEQPRWKTVISDDCVSFFDGCNNCRKEPGSDIVACTKKACMEYEEPRCLDDEQPTTNTPPTPTQVEHSGEPVVDCGTKNAECALSDDCCGSMGLECQEVRTSDGGFSNRCLPVEVQICKSDCDDSSWSAPRGCRAGVAPADMVACEDIVGTDCKQSTSQHRNTRECTDT